MEAASVVQTGAVFKIIKFLCNMSDLFNSEYNNIITI